MPTIKHHPDTFNLIELADIAFERGEVEIPLDYVNTHIDEYADAESLYMDIQRVYEARCFR